MGFFLLKVLVQTLCEGSVITLQKRWSHGTVTHDTSEIDCWHHDHNFKGSHKKLWVSWFTGNSNTVPFKYKLTVPCVSILEFYQVEFGYES